MRPAIDPAAPPPPRRRRAATAVRLWAGITLGSTVLLAALVVWHLIRRGRLVRSRLGPPRMVTPLETPGGGPS